MLRLLVLLASLLLAPFARAAQDAAPARIVAVGDLHGDSEGWEEIARAAGVVNAKGNWSGCRTTLVQMGDITDRGPDSLKIIRQLQRLAGQAPATGGQVIVLLGNHEAMNVTGDLRYVHPGEYEFELIDNSLVSYIAMLVMLSAIVAALFAFFGKMRAIVVSVGEGDPFIAENAQRLGSMAWLLLGVEVLTVLVGLVRLYLANLASRGGDRLGFSVYDLTGAVMVLVLFILARVFRKGTEMRADLEGTV